MGEPTLPLRAAPPRPTRLNPRVLAAAGAIVALTIAGALWYGFRSSTPPAGSPEPETTPRPGAPQLPDMVQALPSTYEQLVVGAPKAASRQWTARRPMTRPVVSQKPELPRTAGFEPPPAIPVDTDGVQQRRQQEAEAAARSPVTFTVDAGIPRARAADATRPSTPTADPAATLIEAAMRALPRSAGDTGGSAPAGLPGPPPVDPNLQDGKRRFAGARRADSPYVNAALSAPRSPYEITAGSVIPGVLLTGIHSDLPGQIVGQVREHVYDTVTGRYLLIPQGTRVIGEYDSRIAYGQERVLVVWTRLVLPNGASISLEGMPGVDLRGYAGLSDRVNTHWGKILAGVVLGTVFGASAQVATGPVQPASPEFEDLATAGAARNLNQVGQEIARKNLAVQPTLEIRPGFRFNFFVHKDLVLRPYPF